MQMILFPLLVVMALVSTTHGMPAVATDNSATVAGEDANPIDATNDTVVFQSGTGIHDCGSSTYNNLTSDASPTISDCMQIATNIQGGGSWTFETGSWHQLVSYGTCRMSILCPGIAAGVLVRIGNQDIIDLIENSVNMFGTNGQVGADGAIACQADMFWPSTLNNEWNLYHT